MFHQVIDYEGAEWRSWVTYCLDKKAVCTVMSELTCRPLKNDDHCAMCHLIEPTRTSEVTHR